jgi:DNA-binding NtrC family response regulator
LALAIRRSTAFSRRTALTLAEKGEYRLALLDYRMPDMSGTELFLQLRSLDGTIDVILITGHANTDVAGEAAKVAMHALLAKPLDQATAAHQRDLRPAALVADETRNDQER